MIKSNYCGIYKNDSFDEYEYAKLLQKEKLGNLKRTLITFKDLNGVPSYRNILVSDYGNQFSKVKSKNIL